MENKYQSEMQFHLSSDQCRVLVLLEQCRSVRELSTLLRRDPSVVSRQLKAIDSMAPVLTKRGSAWALTETGKKLNQWTRNAIRGQSQILNQSSPLRVAGPNFVLTEIVTPYLLGPLSQQSTESVSLVASSHKLESTLLDGHVDMAFGIGAPTTPDIRFRRIATMAMEVVCTPQFKSQFLNNPLVELASIPNLRNFSLRGAEYDRLYGDSKQTLTSSNDLLSLKRACLSDMGWTLLPRFLTHAEIESGKLVCIPKGDIPAIQLGLWWANARPDLQPYVQTVLELLRHVQLFTAD